MQLSDVINSQWLEPRNLAFEYQAATPFPHIVMPNFIRVEVLAAVADEFPDLAALSSQQVKKFDNLREVKFASKGMASLSPHALILNSYLQSDLFLSWLNALTGIVEPLISDPYLAGGGYHEIRRGGFLKVHADFNKHPRLDLDRRLNLLIYLNRDWLPEWGGALELYGDRMDKADREIPPLFNTAVIFSTTSFTFHGHPDPLNCPPDRARRSLAYYYFSTGRPESEVAAGVHSTIFKQRTNEKF
jgi:Rps23 Pro-64 3,4-dihydroxylase Tpa1-like proline 4-hydroxylase